MSDDEEAPVSSVPGRLPLISDESPISSEHSPLSVDEKRALARELLLRRQFAGRPPPSSDRRRSEGRIIEAWCRDLESMIRRGGPTFDEWGRANAWAEAFVQGVDEQVYTRDELRLIQDLVAAHFRTSSVAGFIRHKPHGYPGDFELIDRIYTRLHLAPASERWDRFFYEHPGAQAVRNRKDYFKKVLGEAQAARPGLGVLDVACGPCRDISEWFEGNPQAGLTVHCLDKDPEAIRYAHGVLGPHAKRVQFVNENIRNWRPEEAYDLIWSAGLFDYFDDRLFVETLERFMTWVRPGGTIIIGNFSPQNPSRAWMTILDWILTYRSETHLIELARRCGVPPERISVGREPLGINLFLHLQL